MGGVIGDLLPTAIGVALSPVPIIAVILILGTPRARSNGLAFGIGWVLGLVVVSVIVVLVAGGASGSDSPTWVGWVKLLLGLLFLVMAVGQWRSRPKPGVEPTMPKWMSAIDTFSPITSLGMGALLSGLNPKNLALTLAASATIAQAGLSGGQTTVAIAIFVIIGSLTVAGPVLFYVFAPSAAAGPLNSIKTFMADHNAVIMMIVLLILGAKMVGQGIGGLTG
jgi:threonine/homoserine/homoserine lactone efflux protein